MSARRNGIIIRIPSSPPSTATSITRDELEIEPQNHDRRHRDADTESDRLTGRTGCLNDVVFENRGVAQTNLSITHGTA